MTRILFISQYLNHNGTEAFMMSVFRGLDRTRFGVDFLLYTQQESDYTREVEAAGGHIYRVTSRRESPMRWHRELNAFFRDHGKEYHAVHFCGNSLTSIAPLWYAYRYGVPVRISHAHSSFCSGLHNRLMHKAKRCLAKHITTHHLACSTLAARWYYGNSPAVVIPNSIDIDKFRYNPAVRQDMRTALDLPADALVLGHVGRFTVEKNHNFLIDIFAAFVRRHPSARLLLIGQGPLLQQAKDKAASLGLTDSVLFLGQRQDVAQLMQAMDLFVMPSTFEGLPYVLIEAQAAGLPCLLSDAINADAALLETSQFMSLSQEAMQWSDQADRMLQHYERHDTSTEVAKAGYSLENTLTMLTNIYATQP